MDGTGRVAVGSASGEGDRTPARASDSFRRVPGRGAVRLAGRQREGEGIRASRRDAVALPGRAAAGRRRGRADDAMKAVNVAGGIGRRTLRGLVLSILVLGAPDTWAHGLRLAFLEGVEQAPGVWQLAVRVPVLGERAGPLVVELPAACIGQTAPTIRRLASGDQAVYRSVRCGPGRHEVTVAGIQAGVVDLLVRLENQAGDHSVRVVTSADPRFALEARGEASLFARINLGLEHILT